MLELDSLGPRPGRDMARLSLTGAGSPLRIDPFTVVAAPNGLLVTEADENGLLVSRAMALSEKGLLHGCTAISGDKKDERQARSAQAVHVAFAAGERAQCARLRDLTCLHGRAGDQPLL